MYDTIQDKILSLELDHKVECKQLWTWLTFNGLTVHDCKSVDNPVNSIYDLLIFVWADNRMQVLLIESPCNNPVCDLPLQKNITLWMLGNFASRTVFKINYLDPDQV